MLKSEKKEFVYNNKKITYFYNDNYFKITTDNLCLANFVKVNDKDKVLVEFGSGLFVIPLLLSTIYTKVKIFGFEIDKDACSLSKLSIKENNLSDQINVINDDIKNINKYFKINSIDIIVCNPPYFTFDNHYGVSNNNYLKNARHEGMMSINGVCYYAKVFLRDGGSLFLIERVDRFFEISNILKENRFAIKKIQFIYHDLNSNSKLVLIEARKSGKECGLNVLKPVILEINKEGDIDGKA